MLAYFCLRVILELFVLLDLVAFQHFCHVMHNLEILECIPCIPYFCIAKLFIWCIVCFGRRLGVLRGFLRLSRLHPFLLPRQVAHKSPIFLTMHVSCFISIYMHVQDLLVMLCKINLFSIVSPTSGLASYITQQNSGKMLCKTCCLK